MADRSAIDTATRRLAAALDGLEAALDRRSEADARAAALTDQIALLGVDRSRLASELDRQMARTHRLRAANEEVSRRLDAVTETVRSVVDEQEG